MSLKNDPNFFNIYIKELQGILKYILAQDCLKSDNIKECFDILKKANQIGSIKINVYKNIGDNKVQEFDIRDKEIIIKDFIEDDSEKILSLIINLDTNKMSSFLNKLWKKYPSNIKKIPVDVFMDEDGELLKSLEQKETIIMYMQDTIGFLKDGWNWPDKISITELKEKMVKDCLKSKHNTADEEGIRIFIEYLFKDIKL